MVRRRHAQRELSQVVLFGLVLPEPERLMEPWLREVDKALGDEEIVEAVMTVMRRRWQQSARRGRAGTPAEVVLRMLTLKHLRDWSYDELEREVTGSLVYRRFCRIAAGKVPDAKTMVRLGQVIDGPTLCHGHRTRERVTHERQRWFKRGRAWRAGGEARISRLKNTFGMQRSRY